MFPLNDRKHKLTPLKDDSEGDSAAIGIAPIPRPFPRWGTMDPEMKGPPLQGTQSYYKCSLFDTVE